RTVTSPDLSKLAKRAAEAQAAAGDPAAAIATYRRALDFEPTSGELLGRIDELLRDQGNPAERVALYRAALERGGGAPGRRLERRANIAEDAREQVGWLTRLGELEKGQGNDGDAAIATWKRAAALARSAGDDAIARDLYERVRAVAPFDAHATPRLAELLERA